MILPAMILQMMAVGLRKRGRLRLCYSSLNNADAQLHNAVNTLQIVVQSFLNRPCKAKGSGGDDDIALCAWGSK